MSCAARHQLVTRYFSNFLLSCMSSSASCTSLAPVTMKRVCQMPRSTLGNRPLNSPFGPCNARNLAIPSLDQDAVSIQILASRICEGYEATENTQKAILQVCVYRQAPVSYSTHHYITGCSQKQAKSTCSLTIVRKIWTMLRSF